MARNVGIVGLILVLAACGNAPDGDEKTTDTDQGGDTDPGTDTDEPVVDTPTYTRVLLGGEVTTEGIEPHAAVFGDVQYVDPPTNMLPYGPDPLHVRLGLPTNDPSRSVSMVWSTDLGTLASQVQLREGADLSADAFTEADTREGVSYTYGGSTNDRFRTHELKILNELKPGTSYSYRVGGESGEASHWSEVFTFTTPPAPSTSATFSVAMAGDSRGSYEDWGALVAQMMADGPDLVMFSGDMVATGTNEFEWYAWAEATADAFAETYFVPALGNHEYLSTNYFSRFSLPGNEQYFDVRWKSLHVAALVDYFVDEVVIDEEQPAFLKSTLGASDAPWKATVNHVAFYSIADGHASDEDLRASWAPTFDEIDLDFAVSGHNHTYERSVPIRADKEDADGTVYLVAGGAGAPIYSKVVDDGWWNVVSKPQMHYILATFSPTEVQMVVKDVQGNQIDQFSLSVRQ